MATKLTKQATLVVMTLLFFQVTYAQVAWDGGAGTTNWNDAQNWDSDVLPVATDDVEIGAYVVEVPAGVTAVAKTINLLNFADLTVTAAGVLSLSDGTGFSITLDAAALTVEGTLNISSCVSGIAVKDAASVLMNTGNITIDNYTGIGLQLVTNCSVCNVENYGAMIFDNGTSTSQSAINIQQVNATTFTNYGIISIGATANAGGGIALGLWGNTMDNYGVIDILMTGSGKPGLSHGFIPGTLNNFAGGMVNFDAGIGGTQAISGFNFNLVNNGTVDFNEPGSVDVVLKGSGTIAGTEVFNNVNKIAPGNSPGCLTFASGLTHSGNTAIELGGLTSCTDYDKLSVSGTATISGSLTVTLYNGFTPTAGQSFIVLEADVISGTFSSENYPSVSGITWTTTYNATSVVANANATLPVELVDFDARAFDQAITVNWQTASETNNRGFSIERSSDSKGWEAISFVAGKGDIAERQSYTFIDKAPLSGINYYRLQQLDYDGAFEYSKVVNARIESGDVVDVYPNPAVDVLRLSGLSSNDASIRIINSAGRTVRQEVLTGDVINVSQLLPGIYYLEILTEAQSVYKRFVIRR